MFNYPSIKLLHEELKKPMQIPNDEKDWPESWKTVEFKEYPRMPYTVLPEPHRLEKTFSQILEQRSSKRNFDPKISLSLQQLSNLLYWSAGLHKNKEHPEQSFRFHPSGGARYPLEIYLSFRGNNELESGVYHYNIKKHGLEKIHTKKGDVLLREIPTYPWVKDAAALVYIAAVFDRTMRKYRERGYRFVNLDSGILFHNLYLVSEALNLGCCGVGTLLDREVEEILDIDGIYEGFISHLAIGPCRY